MKKRSNSPTIFNISEFALKRDKKIASMEMRDYFANKNRQEKTWHLITAVKSSLRQNVFSIAEVKKITEFLVRKFEIRLPAIEYAQAFGFSTIPHESSRAKTHADFMRKPNGGNELFFQLFLRLQAGIQDNLLDYKDACVLVREIITLYPKAKGYLQR